MLGWRRGLGRSAILPITQLMPTIITIVSLLVILTATFITIPALLLVTPRTVVTVTRTQDDSPTSRTSFAKSRCRRATGESIRVDSLLGFDVGGGINRPSRWR